MNGLFHRGVEVQQTCNSISIHKSVQLGTGIACEICGIIYEID